MKKFISIVLVLLVGFIFMGCEEQPSEILPTEITIAYQTQTIKVGEHLDLIANMKPLNVTDGSVAWKSSDSSIATVTSKGTVTGVSAGKVTISVTSKIISSVTAKVEITIVEDAILPTAIEISGESEINVGELLELAISFTPENATQKGISWSSSDDTVATVSVDGVVTGVKEGTVTITAKSSEVTTLVDSIEITVKTIVTSPITGLTLTCEEESDLVKGYDFTITETIEPADVTYTLIWSSSDETVATVSDTGVVSALSVGTVTITAKVEDSAIEKSLTFNVVEPPALTGFSITNFRNITNKEFCNLKIEVEPKYASYDVTWSSSNEAIATVDSTGKVTPVGIGEVTITAVENTLNVTESCTITIELAFDPNAKPTSITVSGEESVYVGYTIRLSAQVFPAGVSQSVTWEIPASSADIATISSDGVLTALGEGTVRIKAVSTVDNTIKSSSFRIEISVEPAEDAYQNLGGFEIVIMNAESALSDIDPFLDGYKGADKAFKQKAWLEVENNFNCNISVQAYPDTAPWGPQRIKWINDNAMNNTSKCDFATISPAWLYQFVQAESATDTTTFFNKYGKNQIESALKDSGMYKNKLYIMATGISETKTYPYKGLFYNYGMLKELGLESPAKLFNDDEWSYDDFVAYCLKAQSILPEGKYVMSGGPSIVWAGMVNAAGIKLADKSTLSMNLTHTYSLEAIAALRKVVEANAWDIENIGYDGDCAAFQDGNAIFQPGDYWFVRASNRFPDKLWGDNTQYGYVPFPYPESVGKENTMVNAAGESMYMMVSGRVYPAGVNAEYVYRAVQIMYLNTIKYQKADPQYNATEIKYNATTSRIDDVESIRATIWFTASKTLYDPLYEESFQYEWTGETTTAIINAVKGADAMEELEAIINAVDIKFKNIYAQ